MTKIKEEKRKIKAFISYAHKDKRYFKLLVDGLKSHSKQSKVFNWDIWDDRQILLGHGWYNEIQKAIEECDFAILFISPDFMNSEFCTTEELGEFIKLNKEKGFLFFPILIRDCDFTQLEKVAEKQLFVAHGDDYGFPKKGGKMIAYAELVNYDKEGVLIPNSNIDTYHKDLVKAMEGAFTEKKNVIAKADRSNTSIVSSERKSKEVVEKNEMLKISTLGNQSDVQMNFTLFNKLPFDANDKTGEVQFKFNHATINQAINSLISMKSDAVNQIRGKEILYAGEIFESIISQKELDFATYTDVKNFLGDKGHKKHQWFERSLIVSGLNISIVANFDDRKADLLFEFIIENEDRVWQNAVIGLVYGLSRVYNRLDEYPVIKSKLERLKEIPEVQRAISTIIQETTSMSFDDIEPELNYSKIPYFDKLYRWFIPFHENVEILKQAFKNSELNVNTTEFARLLTNSKSLTKGAKYRVAIAYPDLKIGQINEFINMFTDEKLKFDELETLYPTDVKDLPIRHLIKELVVFQKLRPENKLDKIIKEKQAFANAKLVSLIITDTEKYKLLAELASKNEDYETALEYRLQLEKLEPKNAWNLHQIGYCYGRQKDYGTALKYHLASEKIEPENVWNLHQIGFCYQKQNDYETALKYHLASEKLEPENAWNLCQIGYCYQRQNDYEIALKYHLASEKIEPENAWNLLCIGYCYGEQNDYETALKYHFASKKIEPEDVENLRQIGWVYFLKNDLINSKKYYTKAKEISVNEYLLMNLGHIELCQGNYDLAIAFYQKSILKFENVQVFIEGFKGDFQYVKRNNVEEKRYLEILENLIEYRDNNG